MANKHVKRLLASLAIRKMQIKTPSIPNRMATIKRLTILGDDVEQLEPSCIADGLRDEPWSSNPTFWSHFPEPPSLYGLLGSLALPFSFAARKPGLYFLCSSVYFS